MNPPLPNMRAIQRVLIIRLGAIGDVVHALPVLAALSESFPHLEIGWVVEDMTAPLLEGNPYLKEVIVLPRQSWKRRRFSPLTLAEYLQFGIALRRKRYDLTLDLHGHTKSGLLAFAAGARYRFGWYLLRDGAGLVSQAIGEKIGLGHRVSRYLEVAAALGADVATPKFPIFIAPETTCAVSQTLCEAGILPNAPFAAINLTTSCHERRWGIAQFAEVAHRLAENGIPAVLIGSSKESEVNDACIQMLKASGDYPATMPLPHNFAGKTNLKELAALLSLCSVHITGDTGSAHIAAALGSPVVSVYGPTDPDFAGAWGQIERTLSRRDLCIAGCKRERCPIAIRRAKGLAMPLENPVVAKCLSAVTPDSVAAKALEILETAKQAAPQKIAPS